MHFIPSTEHLPLSGGLRKIHSFPIRRKQHYLQLDPSNKCGNPKKHIRVHQRSRGEMDAFQPKALSSEQKQRTDRE